MKVTLPDDPTLTSNVALLPLVDTLETVNQSLLVGSEGLGYDFSEVFPSIVHLNFNEFGANLIGVPFVILLLLIVAVKIPTRASYSAAVTVWFTAACKLWLPIVKSNSPVDDVYCAAVGVNWTPPGCEVIELLLELTNLWIYSVSLTPIAIGSRYPEPVTRSL